MTAIPTSVAVRPDRDFRTRLIASGGEDLKKCFQCATCSVVCDLACATQPFPRKEMIWAQWGLKDRLLADVDVWLCHGCSDCSSRCPRGARPADVMAAIRREATIHYSTPRWLANRANQPRFLPIFLLLPCLLLGLAAWARAPLEKFLHASYTPNRIIISYWSQLPQWLLITLAVPLVLLDAVVVVLGVMRFWRDLKASDRATGFADNPASAKQSMAEGIRTTLRSIFLHEDFDRCTANHSRINSHRLVLYGFVGLLVVDLWVLTLRFNPLLKDAFVYPFNFWSPWKILANLAGGAMLIGCALMIRDRKVRITGVGTRYDGTWFDWMFLGLALGALLTGFACEVLHYARVDPLRYAAYVIHLATVFALLALLPYSKFAHLIYRATALVYAAHTGRQRRGGLGEFK